MVNTASTEINATMVGFLADHVFMVKEAPGPDHWLAELPPEVFAVVRRAVSEWPRRTGDQHVAAGEKSRSGSPAPGWRISPLSSGMSIDVA